ncbi:MAG TPA: non-reducing end alpha-L-arabinofuranosidase family hydrolase, partial [Polyangia bacterium]|nr:non-reducing end alpha-L-arabinofuranosidase family hydrolase [Polyangia bacterium]
SVVRWNGRWHVYASSVARGGIYGMVYTSFADWSDAPKAPLYYLDQTPGFHTYVAAPELFYFTPQKKWYLVFQSGPPMYATADDPGDPTKWTAPQPFFARTPAIVDQNGGWLDFWVICDADNCHLFFSNDHGRWYRTETPRAQFPAGFGDPVVVLEDADAGRVFEASNVYKIAGQGTYLALIEAFDATSSYHRYFRSWTAARLEGPWTVLDDDGAAPFAGAANVSFDGPTWTRDVSHGEMIRAGYDEKLEIDGGKLQYLYQGADPAAPTADYNAIPWRLGLLTLR